MENKLIDKYNKDGQYKLNLSNLKELHTKTQKKELIHIICQLMDKYNVLYRKYN